MAKEKIVEEDLTSWLTKEFLRRRMEKDSIDKRIYLNFALLTGRHQVEYNSTIDRLLERQLPKWKESFAINHILPRYRILHSKFISARPSLKVSPNTLEQEDLSAADIGTNVLRYWWRQRNVSAKIRSLYRWVLIGGSALLNVFWDESITTVIHKGRNEFESIKGDVEVKVVNPLSIFPDALANDEFSSTKSLIYAHIEHVDEIRMLYKNNEIVPTGEKAVSNWEDRLDKMLLGKKKKAEVVTTDGVLILEYFEFPNVIYPKGRYVCTAGKELLSDEDELPDGGWTKYDFVPIPGQWFARDMIVDLEPLNKQYEKSNRQIAVWRNLTILPKLPVPTTANLDKDAYTSEPGEKLEYNPMPGVPPPAILPQPSLPQWILLWNQQLINDMNDILITHDVSFGKYPKRVTSGKAIGYLQEQDIGALTDPYTCMEESLSQLGSQVLETIQRNYLEERLIDVIGKHNILEAKFHFKGADLRNNTDVAVQLESGLPNSKIARIDMVMDMWKVGFLKHDEEGRKTGLKIMNIPEFVETELEDEIHALTENGRLLSGEKVEVSDFDNHLIHFKIHNDLAKKATYTDLSRDIKEKLRKHIEAHLKILQSALETRAQIPEGSPPAGGKAEMGG